MRPRPWLFGKGFNHANAGPRPKPDPATEASKPLPTASRIQASGVTRRCRRSATSLPTNLGLDERSDLLAMTKPIT